MRYGTYKNSDIEWLGEIPNHWDSSRFKDFTKIIQDGTHFTPTYTNDGINFLSVNDITRDVFDLSKSKYISVEAHKELIKRCKPLKGDILLSKNGTIGIPFIIDFDTDVSIYVSLCLIRLNKGIYNKYFYYILLSDFMFEQYKINAKTNSVSNLHLDKLANFYSILPPLNEQTIIAQYLDIKTQAIDKKVNLLTQKINHYKELRKSIINDAVCKGLDKNVKFVSNEFGSMPSHWRIGRLKDISKTMSSGATPLTNISAYYENGILNWVNTGDLNDGIINECQYKISEVAIKDYPNLKVNKVGTLLIAMYGATICKIGLLNIEATTNQACCCINFKRDSYSRFVFYWFLANKNKIISLSVGGTQPNISQGIISKLFIAIPPLDEQISIAEYLDKTIQKIDAIVTNIQKQIDTLKELRKTLINDVVTGKIKVTN